MNLSEYEDAHNQALQRTTLRVHPNLASPEPVTLSNAVELSLMLPKKIM